METYRKLSDGRFEPMVAVSDQGVAAIVGFNRSSDTNAYTAGDVEGSGTAAGGAVLEFDFIDRDGLPFTGGELMITTAALEIDVNGVPANMTSYRLHLYGLTPPSALGDNAAWDLPAGDRAAYAGYVDLGSPADLGSTLYVKSDGINSQITVPATGKLFGYLVTNGGYTPASATARKITLHGIPV